MYRVNKNPAVRRFLWVDLFLLLLPLAAEALTYSYDDLSRLEQVRYDDGTLVVYAYDPGGNILSVTTNPEPTNSTTVMDARFLFVGQPHPNPFSTRMGFFFEIRAAQRVEVAVYDIAGRLVKRLYEGVHAPGSTRIFWDGRNTQGGKVASGVYFARVNTEHRTTNLRMLLIR